MDGYSYKPYSENVDGTPKVFNGNTNSKTQIENRFGRELEARYVRVIPVEAAPGGIALRVNFLGCFLYATAVPEIITQLIPTPRPGLVATVEPGMCVTLMWFSSVFVIIDTV